VAGCTARWLKHTIVTIGITHVLNKRNHSFFEIDDSVRAMQRFDHCVNANNAAKRQMLNPTTHVSVQLSHGALSLPSGFVDFLE